HTGRVRGLDLLAMMDTNAVTRMSREVGEPAELGIDPHRLEVLLRRVEIEVQQGFLPSAAVAVARHGRLVAERTWGESRGRYLLQSVGGTVVAGGVWEVIGEGKIAIGVPVAGG